MNNLVSIIIPCYNAQLTIERAIRSVLMQTYLNIEIIVINDGSDDESGRIIQNMMSEYKNIVLISTENQGVSSARNRGIKEAKGKYITFLDADDIYAQNFIDTLVYAMEHHVCDTAYCRWTRDNFKGSMTLLEESPATFLKKQMLKRKNKISFFNYIYCRGLLLQNHILFSADLRYGEDNLFVMEYLSHCKKAVSIDASLYKYNDNKESAMHNTNWHMVDNLKAVKQIEQVLAEAPIYDDYCKFAFPRAVWALAKDFARAREYGLFIQLDRMYHVKKCMKKLIKQQDVEYVVKILSVVYILHKRLFYIFISLMGKYSNKM